MAPLHNSTCPHPSYPPTDSIIGRIKQWTMDSKFQQVSFQNLWKAQWSEWLQLPCSMVWCNSRPCPVEPKQLYELYQTSQPSLHIESHSAFLTQSLEDMKISHIITLKAPCPQWSKIGFTVLAATDCWFKLGSVDVRDGYVTNAIQPKPLLLQPMETSWLQRKRWKAQWAMYCT